MQHIDTQTPDTLEKVKNLKLLAHPIRYSIALSLHENGEMNVSAIQDVLELPQSTVSQHISKLREQNLVDSARDGTKIFYKLTNPIAIQVIEALNP